jgi:hypothetical protein
MPVRFVLAKGQKGTGGSNEACCRCDATRDWHWPIEPPRIPRVTGDRSGRRGRVQIVQDRGVEIQHLDYHDMKRAGASFRECRHVRGNSAMDADYPGRDVLQVTGLVAVPGDAPQW